MSLPRWKIDFERRPINLYADSSGDWCKWEDVAQLIERVKIAETAWLKRWDRYQEVVIERDRLG